MKKCCRHGMKQKRNFYFISFHLFLKKEKKMLEFFERIKDEEEEAIGK